MSCPFIRRFNTTEEAIEYLHQEVRVQQELIEGIENIISDKGYYFPYAETTLDILSYLNSRDVVIRVDRERLMEYDNYNDPTRELDNRFEIAAVEPLIEEKHD